MPLAASTLLCFVIAVSDGDTLRARCGGHAGKQDAVTVRLAAIDAPEHGQPYGRRARQALRAMVQHQDVRLECVDTDRYARQVCSVWVAPESAPDGPKTLDAGLALLTVGLAWWNPAYAWEQTPQQRGQYEFAQTEARAKHAGLWRDTDAVAPWQWRKSHPRPPR